MEYGVAKLPKIAARGIANFVITSKNLKLGANTQAGERFITFTVQRKAKTEWSPARAEIGFAQFALDSKKISKPKARSASELREIIDADGNIHLPFGQTSPKLTLFRAPTENDTYGHIAPAWQAWGLNELTIDKSKVSFSKGQALITRTYKTGSGIAIKHLQKVVAVSGGLSVTETITTPALLKDLPRIGTTFELSGELQNFEFFGAGPHESYPDRNFAPIGRYTSTVADQYIPYVVPQESGGHSNVRWFELTNAAGAHLLFVLDKPRQVSVTPFTTEQLAKATHDVELKPNGNTVVVIDAAHRGIGTASCGPDTLEKYLIKPGAHTFTWTVLAG